MKFFVFFMVCVVGGVLCVVCCFLGLWVWGWVAKSLNCGVAGVFCFLAAWPQRGIEKQTKRITFSTFIGAYLPRGGGRGTRKSKQI